MRIMFKLKNILLVVVVVLVFVFFDSWYVRILVSLLVIVFVRYIFFLTSKAIIADFYFRGSEKDDNNNYTTFFNVSFYNSIDDRIELEGLVDTDYELTENDVLNILSSTSKKEITKGIRMFKNGPVLISRMFKHLYEHNGNKLEVTYMPRYK